jgi:predicted nucleic acid-binding protein
MTSVACDAGPLTHLWQIDLWSTLGTFEAIHLTARVVVEVQEHVPLERLERLASCTVRTHEIARLDLESVQVLLPSELVLEEADLATLALARQVTPDLLLTDDLALRRAAEACGLIPMGSVGVLLRAYSAGYLDTTSLDQAINGLFVHSTLYLSPAFKSYVRKLIADTVSHRHS